MDKNLPFWSVIAAALVLTLVLAVFFLTQEPGRPVGDAGEDVGETGPEDETGDETVGEEDGAGEESVAKGEDGGEAHPDDGVAVEDVETAANRSPIGEVAKTRKLRLVFWTDSEISMGVPDGWDVYAGGECPTKSILARDPDSELKQVFYFSEAGPVYTSEGARESDLAYMAMGGYPVLWADSPVVDPLTSENYLRNFGELVSGDIFQGVFPQAPVLEDVEIISAEARERPYFATDAKLIRAKFVQNGKPGEGYFYVLTADLGFGLGYGMMVVGITAPEGLLDLLAPSLRESLRTFSVSQEYVSGCIDAGNRAAAGALQAGNALGKTSDIIMEGWESKLEAEGRMAGEWSDAMLGRSRLYDPDVDEVYGVTPEFFDYYLVHRNEFEMSGLQEMPDDKWSYAPLNGGAHIY